MTRAASGCDVHVSPDARRRRFASSATLNSGVIAGPAAPFGGVKKSGLGREGGQEGIEEYLEVRGYAGRP